MCIWRDSTVDAPIYADIVARIIHVYPITLYLSVFCFGKFTCNITRPASWLKVVDKRRRNNYIDASLCVGVSIMWSLLLLTTTRGRYKIVEDIGPLPMYQMSVESFLIQTVPLGMIAAASTYYNLLTASNIWRARRSGSTLDATGLGAPEQTHYRKLSNRQTSRYFVLVIIHFIGLPFGFLWTLLPFIIYRHGLVDDEGRPWYFVFDVRGNIRQLPLIYTFHRGEIRYWINLAGFLVAVPTNGILFFLLFGLGSDILEIYRVWFDSLCLKISNMLSSIRRLGTNIPWPTREPSPSTALENITPFRPDEIALESYSPPVQTTRKRHPPHSGSAPSGAAVLLPSSPSPLRGRSTMDRVSPMSPLERSRTFHKQPIPEGLSPLNRSNSYSSPGEPLSGANNPNNASSSRGTPKDPFPYCSIARNKAHGRNHSMKHCSPPYEPAREGSVPSGLSRNL
ncbi:hypothetical protein FRB91_004066 [Serendipita sp. 411]|nr:hypothetical protein FRB91_004066 [Serendipita sp. 411]